MKKFLTIFAAILLLMPLSCVKSEGEAETDPDPVSVPELKVMSFNVRQSHAGDSGDRAWSRRKDACVAMLKKQMPDIVGLQEAYWDDQFHYLKQALSATHEGYAVGREDGKKKGETVGFIYNNLVLQLDSCGTFWLSGTPDVPSDCYGDGYERPVGWGFFKVRSSGKSILYLNVHMPLNGTAQLRSISQLVKWISARNVKGYPVILTGDFNMIPDNTAFTSLRQLMSDTRDVAIDCNTDRLKTYNAWGKEQKATICDYVWITPDLECLEYRTDNSTKYGSTFISDHYPVFAILNIQ